MSLACEVALPFVANSAVEDGKVPRPLRTHVESCARCQARHMAMARAASRLRSLAGSETPAPPQLEWKVMSSLDADLAVPHSWRRPVAVGAVLVSTAAAVIIWRMRLRTS